MLPSVLGVDGYNPSAGQYEPKAGDVPAAAGDAKAGTPAAAPAKPVVAPPVAAVKSKPTTASTSTSFAGLTRVEKEQKIDQSIQTLMKYRTAGDGGNALKLLLTFVKNINDNPQEMKYRSINTESSAFKSKLASLIGPLIILRVLGFQASADEEGKLKLEG